MTLIQFFQNWVNFFKIGSISNIIFIFLHAKKKKKNLDNIAFIIFSIQIREPNKQKHSKIKS